MRRIHLVYSILLAHVLYVKGDVISPSFISVLAFTIITNVITDYASLFIVRRFLRKGMKSAIALIQGPIVGVLFVFLTLWFVLIFPLVQVQEAMCSARTPPSSWCPRLEWLTGVVGAAGYVSTLSFSAFAVHLWLLVLASCIAILKVLNWLRKAVGKSQWFFKGGKEHPLDVIGYIAASLVFVSAGALRLAGVIG
jgi:hypothetical protein